MFYIQLQILWDLNIIELFVGFMGSIHSCYIFYIKMIHTFKYLLLFKLI